MAEPTASENVLAFVRAFISFGRWRAAAAAVLITVCAFVDGVGLLLLVPILQVVTGRVEGPGVVGRLGRTLLAPLRGHLQAEGLALLLSAFVMLMVVRSVLLAGRDRALAKLQFEFVDFVRRGLVLRLARAGWRDVLHVRHARIIQALSVEIHQIGIAANSMLLLSVASGMLIAYCVLALILAPAAATVAIGFAVVGAIITGPYLRKARTLGRSITQAHFGMTDAASSFLSGLKLAAAEGLQETFAADYESVSRAATRDRMQFSALQSDLRNITAAVAAVFGAAALFFGLVAFHLSSPVLITLLLTLSRMSTPAQLIQQCAQQILHSLPAFGMIDRLQMELTCFPTAPCRIAAVGPPERAPVAVRSLSFGYRGERPPVLQAVSLAIPAGAFVGIVGASGAGKTTFLDLVLGLLTPATGEALVSGLDLSRQHRVCGREAIAYVTQDSPLFDDTIRRNLTWSQPACSDQDMRGALERVGAVELLARLEQGLDTRIGERGILLSAGERQRLGLARALLRRPVLLVLDEATNAIDIESERSILQNLAALTPRTTILMVAHRTESLDFCDHLLLFPGPTLSAVRRGAAAS